ncbi:hypothetical protein O181_067084 [Austropuccinia psidii MF-1]|uniref:Uncharacterized protein n=1 Tax=Austropuccinia psidii MF-1 TaxID=1389203 RepID=A0A9Q3EU79_9BASI|nr:hypothetical protein [Austropuccinia psidii MF-1]
MASIDGKEKYDAFKNKIEEKNSSPRKQVPKPAAVPMLKSNYKLKKMAKAKNQPQLHTARPTDSQRLNGCHGKCISDGHSNEEITEKGGSQIKRSEVMSDILDGIPNFYIAINDMKTHISDKGSTIFTNLKNTSV